jgi:hypothetical protein
MAVEVQGTCSDRRVTAFVTQLLHTGIVGSEFSIFTKGLNQMSDKIDDSMINLKINDVVFLEDIGVYAVVESVGFSQKKLPSIAGGLVDSDGSKKYLTARHERASVVVQLRQVDKP